MADFSTYKNLELPKSPEHYNIQVFNKNNMVIDSELHKLDLKNQSQDNLLATKESLNNEILRATNKENELDETLSNEISRAQFVENGLSNDINNEFNRAIVAETTIENNLSILIKELTIRLNALADSDDTTLDQLSEIVAYIKNNKSLIDSITTSKVNVSDIIDNLDSTAENKVLSSKQGNVLKSLITDLTEIVGNKIDKVSGKGLSTNDYTTTEKNKLSGIASGANVNVQPDWDSTDVTSDAFIKNKPTSMPSSDEFILIVEQPLIFTNNICTIFDDRITSHSLAYVHFTSDTIDIAEQADIFVETYDENVKLTAVNSPAGNIKATIQIRVV